jgi:hypothetical protein
MCEVLVRRDAPQGKFAHVMCAVTENANEQLILTAKVIDRLISLNCYVIQSDESDEGRVNEDNCDD